MGMEGEEIEEEEASGEVKEETKFRYRSRYEMAREFFEDVFCDNDDD